MYCLLYVLFPFTWWICISSLIATKQLKNLICWELDYTLSLWHSVTFPLQFTYEPIVCSHFFPERQALWLYFLLISHSWTLFWCIAFPCYVQVAVLSREKAETEALVSCLLRTLEGVSGTVLIDGVDLARLGLQDLRRRINVIPQVRWDEMKTNSQEVKVHLLFALHFVTE